MYISECVKPRHRGIMVVIQNAVVVTVSLLDVTTSCVDGLTVVSGHYHLEFH